MQDSQGLKPEKEDHVERRQQHKDRPVAPQMQAPTPNDGHEQDRKSSHQGSQTSIDHRRRVSQTDLYDRKSRPPEQHQQGKSQHHVVALAKEPQSHPSSAGVFTGFTDDPGPPPPPVRRRTRGNGRGLPYRPPV